MPPRVQQVDLKFPREGIDYDSLSDEEQEQWESLDWGDDVEETSLPDRVDAAAINSWLFNKDTVDKVLQHLMEHGHTVDGGDRLAKTILFARNHTHAHVHRGAIQSPLPTAQGILRAHHRPAMRPMRRASWTTSHRRTRRRTSPSRWTCSTPASTFPR